MSSQEREVQAQFPSRWYMRGTEMSEQILLALHWYDTRPEWYLLGVGPVPPSVPHDPVQVRLHGECKPL